MNLPKNRPLSKTSKWSTETLQKTPFNYSNGEHYVKFRKKMKPNTQVQVKQDVNLVF